MFMKNTHTQNWTFWIQSQIINMYPSIPSKGPVQPKAFMPCAARCSKIKALTMQETTTCARANNPPIHPSKKGSGSTLNATNITCEI